VTNHTNLWVGAVPIGYLKKQFFKKIEIKVDNYLFSSGCHIRQRRGCEFSSFTNFSKKRVSACLL